MYIPGFKTITKKLKAFARHTSITRMCLYRMQSKTVRFNPFLHQSEGILCRLSIPT